MINIDMKKFIITMLCVWVGLLQATSQCIYRNDDLTVSLLKPHVWVVETTDMTTMYIIEGTKRALLIDTGTKCAQLDKVVRQVTSKPYDVVLTHVHPDHAGNVSQFPQIYLHAADTILLSDYHYSGQLHYVEDGHQFNLGGGLKIEVMTAPGHTPGSIVLFNRKTGDSFSGDSYGSGECWLQLRPHLPYEVYLQSCRRMEKLMQRGVVKRLWCGHYPYMKKAYDIDYLHNTIDLATQLVAGDESNSHPYRMPLFNLYKGSARSISKGEATIVYDAELIPLQGGRERSFNDHWHFKRDSIIGAESILYNHYDWQKVDLPHDFSMMDLEGDDSDTQVGAFSKASPGGNHTGFAIGGTGWYRKSFVIDKRDANKRFNLLFDGAYMETDVWVNGQLLMEHKHGYTPFAVDITEALSPAGEENIIAVRTRNIGRNSRWYSGSGIYRDVTLLVTDPIHVATWGAFISTPEVSTQQANVSLELKLQNETEADASVDVSYAILDMNQKKVASTVSAVSLQKQATRRLVTQLTVAQPQLWSVDTPHLYQMLVEVRKDGQLVDVYKQPFGIRSLEFSAEKGFLLNGQPTELRGACLHHDNGFLGAAAIRSAEYRRVALMKKHGYNAIRCSHNAPSSAFLQACDELGMLVIDEFTDMWNIAKNPYDYARFFEQHWEQDLTDMILRDRNHPSIILWSIGNEIPKANIGEGAAWGKRIADKVRALDPSRKTTEGVPSFLIHGGWKNTKDYFAQVDVCGYNYTQFHFETDHQLYPQRVMYTSEAYPNKAYQGWKLVERHPYVIGEFVWTAMDYIGEVGLGNSLYLDKIDTRSMQNRDGIPEGTDPTLIFQMMEKFSTPKWPEYLSWCGDLDIIGEKKPQGLYRDVLWDRSPIEVCVHEPIPEGKVESVSTWGWPREYAHWNWKGCENRPLQVRVFTKAQQVKLLLNGQEVGRYQLKEDDEYIATFQVPYVAGELTAVALCDGKEVGKKQLVTTGEPCAIRLTADRTQLRADRQDLSFIRIDLVDKQGRLTPTAECPIVLEVSGCGEMAASGNANPYGIESANRKQLRTFRGQAQLIVRPTGDEGKIKVTVRGQAVEQQTLEIEVK